MDKFVYECGGLVVDPANRRLTRQGRDLALEPKAFAALLELMHRPGELVTRDDLLDRVWGHRHVTPTTLNRAITLLRKAFDDDADKPRVIQTVHGAGYRFIANIRQRPVERAAMAPAFGPPPMARLPAKLEALVGRETELERLLDLLAEHRAVTIIGPGGMGKTQCALELGRLCGGMFPDGVWFFDLSPFERVSEWLATLLATLGLPDSDDASRAASVVKAFAGRHALLLVDNCDRMAAQMGVLAFELLRACPHLRLLATSQCRLDLVGEQLVWLPPLALPTRAEANRNGALEALAAVPSMALLSARARAVQPAFAITMANVDDMIEICHRLDGMPLALELAAAQLVTLSPAALRERLQERLDLLVSGSAGRDLRHQTLRALVDWSCDLLSDHEHRLLCWLGVFMQGWTIDALEHIGARWGLDPSAVLQLHSSLVFKSLVVVDPTVSPPRYRLLETLRGYALERLALRGEETSAREAHLQHFVRLAERSQAGIIAGHCDEWVERLRHEHANIESILDWIERSGLGRREALELTTSLMLYAKIHGTVGVLAGWVKRALKGVQPGASVPYVRAILCLNLFRLYLQNPLIEASLQEAALLATGMNDNWAESCATAFLAQWNAHMGNLDTARAHEAASRRLAAAESDDWLRSMAGMAKGWIEIASGRHDEALAALKPLMGLSYDRHQHMMIASYVALAHFLLGQVSQAALAWDESLASSIRTRNLRGCASALEGGGYLAAQTNRDEIAVRLLARAADIRERTGMPLFSFWVASHDTAVRALTVRMGSAALTDQWRATTSARDEDVIQDARLLLRDLQQAQGASVLGSG